MGANRLWYAKWIGQAISSITVKQRLTAHKGFESPSQHALGWDKVLAHRLADISISFF